MAGGEIPFNGRHLADRQSSESDLSRAADSLQLASAATISKCDTAMSGVCISCLGIACHHVPP